MDIFKPPQEIVPGYATPSIFLAGSIEQGKCGNWQMRVCQELSDKCGTIFNPRRNDWDSSWETNANNPQFRRQVEWEFEQQELADIILFYFDPETKAPTTLLELGLALAGSKNCVVCCPDGYWRKGNVDIMCWLHNVPICESLDSLIEHVRRHTI